MVLRLAEVIFGFKVLRQKLVSLLEELLPVLRHQAHHGVVLALLLIHIDGQVWFVDFDVQLLSFFQLSLCFHALRLRY